MLVLLLMAACHTPTREGRQMMAQAKALSDTAPDSAVKLIDSALRMGKRFSEQQRMDLALLQGELVFRDASIDEEVLPEGVSTNPELERASAYFAQRKDYTKAARAALYSGYVQQAYGERENAMRSYKDAEHYGVIVGDSLTMARAECKMGRMLFDDYMEKEALCQFQSAEKNVGNNLNELSLIRNMAAASCLVLGLYDSADYYLKQSLADAERSHSSNAKRKVLNNYAVYHRILGEFDESISCLHRMFNEVDSTLLPIVYLNLGRTYVSLANLDSAYYYYQQLERTLSDFWIKPETKASAYQALSEFAESQKNDSDALKYRKLYEKFIGVVRDQTAQKTVYRIQQRYDYEAEKNILNRKIIHRQRVITIISVLLFISSLVILAFQYRNKKLLKEEEEMKRQIDRMKQELRQSIKPTVLADEVDMRLQIIISAIQTMKHSNDPKREWRPLVNKIMNGKENAFEAAQAAIEMAYPGLYATIIAQHSDLNETEAKICLLSCSSLSNAEIAELLGLKLNTVNQGRSTLRKKMNLKPERLKEQLHHKLFSKKEEA